MPRQKDLTGQKFGRWTVLNITDKRTKNRQVIWHCKCECGNEKDVPGDTLRRGESCSCGCLQKEKAAENARKCRIDITGQRFGKLVALYPIYSGREDKHTKWHCKCDCGNECDIDLGNLRQGFSKSCGCTLSLQEENIIKLLNKLKLKYDYQVELSDFCYKRFDFMVFTEEQNQIIEFDGKQHFEFSGYGWDTEEAQINRHKNDLMKNKYCFEHNIPLIRIPYNAEQTEEDLILETTHFLLTPENEENYYKI